MAERVRICDIAEELGLSTATVSNVIHGKTGKVSAETVERVTALLEEREYIPSMAGIRVPEDISLLGMDDIQLCTMVTPMLSTIHQPLREIAQESIRIIMENEPGAKPQPRRVFLTPTLQVRESTAPPNPVAD